MWWLALNNYSQCGLVCAGHCRTPCCLYLVLSAVSKQNLQGLVKGRWHARMAWLLAHECFWQPCELLAGGMLMWPRAGFTLAVYISMLTTISSTPGSSSKPSSSPSSSPSPSSPSSPSSPPCRTTAEQQQQHMVRAAHAGTWQEVLMLSCPASQAV